MKQKLILNKKLFIANGGERNCYTHLNDYTKVIKVVHRKGYHNMQNELEYKYYQYLLKNNIPMTHLVNCHGFIDTNQGLGLVYDKIVDYNKNISISFKEMVSKNMLTDEIEQELIDELKNYIFKYNILFIDVDLSNVFCCEIKKDKYKLYIIDGLGARRMGWRFNLYLKSKLFTIYKMRKQWKKFIKGYNSIKLNNKN